MMITRVKGTREAPFSQIPSSGDTPGALPGISDRSDGFRLRRDETGFSLWRDIGRSSYGLSVRRSFSSSSTFISLLGKTQQWRGDEGITELKQKIIIAVFLLYPFPKMWENLKRVIINDNRRSWLCNAKKKQPLYSIILTKIFKLSSQ